MENNVEKVNRIREKVRGLYSLYDTEYYGAYTSRDDRQERYEQRVDNKTLFYLQVGEDVLDSDIQQAKKTYKKRMENAGWKFEQVEEQ